MNAINGNQIIKDIKQSLLVCTGSKSFNQNSQK
jgi:hypothetical protein